jgi:hypothetical protein
MKATQNLVDYISPYLRAWTDAADIGEEEFDQICTVSELADFLARGIIALDAPPHIPNDPTQPS